MISEECTEAIQAARMATIIQHVKENNIAYLIGLFISHQMGILDKVFTYGSGICY